MKKSLISIVAIGFLTSCGGGGDSSDIAEVLNNQTDLAENNTNLEIESTASKDYLIPTISETDKEKFLNAINNARAEARDCGDGNGMLPAVGELSWNDDLYKASYEHNYDMLNTNIFGHNGSGTQYDISGIKLNKKSDPLDRVKNNGYIDASLSVYGVGENVADGHTTIQSAVDAWLKSTGHCVNIMNGDFKEMGLSKIDNGNNGFLWTNVFGYKK
jgi:uncharacterized protein YkwD